MNLFDEIIIAKKQLHGVVNPTPLTANLNLSEEYQANILLKREDLQLVRSYKIRGAYNKIYSLSEKERLSGIVCASAGNAARNPTANAARLEYLVMKRSFDSTPRPRARILCG